MKSKDNPSTRETILDHQGEEHIAEMRQMLIEMQAIDTASALRSLRRAFPDAPLADRVRALAADYLVPDAFREDPVESRPVKTNALRGIG